MGPLRVSMDAKSTHFCILHRSQLSARHPEGTVSIGMGQRFVLEPREHLRAARHPLTRLTFFDCAGNTRFQSWRLWLYHEQL